MIIIKSQDGRVLEINDVDPTCKDGAIWGMKRGSEVMILLGQGYSEERAREVMEEIEEHVRYSYASKIESNYRDGNYQELMDGAIYKMPKE